MEWWALVGTISLADNHNINAAGQRGLINSFIQFFNGYQHLTCQLAHVVHGVGLEGAKQLNISRVKGKTEVTWFSKSPEEDIILACTSDENLIVSFPPDFACSLSLSTVDFFLFSMLFWRALLSVISWPACVQTTTVIPSLAAVPHEQQRKCGGWGLMGGRDNQSKSCNIPDAMEEANKTTRYNTKKTHVIHCGLTTMNQMDV